MKTWIYSWVVYPFVFSIATVLGFSNRKVRETLRLRSWKDFLSLRFNVGEPIEYWLHVASAGELEYAIPILEELSRRGKRILVTYYSISAKKSVEQLPQSFASVSLVVPLPHDGLGLMAEFVALVRKQGVRSLLLLKYELWPGLLWECNAHEIKVYLVDALRPSWFHRRLLHKLDGILTGYESEVLSIRHRNVKIVGDTRVERVLQRLARGEAKIEKFVDSRLKARLAVRMTVVGGSMWPADDQLLLEALGGLPSEARPNVIWVPHELDEKCCERVATVLSHLGYGVFRLGAPTETLGHDATLSGKPLAVIVMRKGILVELYRLGYAALVGGAFGAGVHSVWEPALSGLRVACGPQTARSPEATLLENHGLLTHVRTARDLKSWLTARGHEWAGGLEKVTGTIDRVISPHVGAAKRVVEFCERESTGA